VPENEKSRPSRAALLATFNRSKPARQFANSLGEFREKPLARWEGLEPPTF
jgi:hypothetical protein